mgnify:CR=1 FL=1
MSTVRPGRSWASVPVAAALFLSAAALAGVVIAGEGAAPPPANPWSAAELARRFPDPDADAPRADFSGTDRCVECHEDRAESLGTSFHTDLIGSDATTRGCEACHGAGREHSESDGEELVRHPWDVPPAEVVAVCAKCHVDVLEKPLHAHRRWVFPKGPDAEPRSCVQCHEIHVDRTDPQHDPSVGPFRSVDALSAVAQQIPAERCIACHADFHPEMKRSGHANLLTEGAQCGSCHGNGSLHEASGGRERLIIDPRAQRPKDANATCLGCHSGDGAVVRWTCSEHAREGTSCVTCHDPNAPRGRTLRAPEFELCGGCHLDVKARFRLPNRHQVDRGRVQCSDCHDPHGNLSRVRDADVRLRACATCHPEKAGPFVHDHGIKRTEGCVACHDPHGSVNRRMLAYPRVKELCLQCHPETPHDLSERRYANCLACHTEIHGSDTDRLFLERGPGGDAR